MSEYERDLAPLGPLAPVAVALIEYAKALVPGANVVRRQTKWVVVPNFMAFRVPKRTREVIFSVYGHPKAFKKSPALGIYWDRSSYSEFRLDSARQLGAAASYIATACQLSKFKRKSKPQLEDLASIL